MECYDALINALEYSVKKNGEVPLTNKHLLNLVKIVQAKKDREEEEDFYPPDIDY